MKKFASVCGVVLALTACESGIAGGGPAAGTGGRVALAVVTPDLTSEDLRRTVMISNRTGKTMVAFYAAPSPASVWGADVLEGMPLDGSHAGPGAAVSVNFNDGSGACMFDMRAVLANGQEIIRRGVDVCGLNSYAFIQ